MPDVAYKATYRTRTYLSKGRVARTQPVPGLHLERGLLADGASLVGGIDELQVTLVAVKNGDAPSPAPSAAN